jgi:non-ribosomal peptide synthetase-like protein
MSDAARGLSILRGPRRPDLLRGECLPDILAATARRCARKPALVWDGRAVTYGELKRASDAVGGALARRGAGPGRVIGLWLPRGGDLLVAQAGISRSGGAWLPLDAEARMERARACLESAGAMGVVTCREWLPRLKELPAPAWAVEDLMSESGQMPLFSAQPTDPAYLIYTSGSTGAPKGIAVSHRSICHFLRSENEILGVSEDDLVYEGFSVAFDMSFEEIWMSYLAGAALWIAPAGLVADPDLVAQAIHRERITVLHAVPTLMGMISDPLPTVRMINLGGEACPEALARRLCRPGRRLFNTYGPTEAAVSASIAELKAGEAVTIGRPLPNYGLMVVDERRQPVAAGEAGELCIFGPGLAIGYAGQPALTAQKFVANPWAENAGEERMYLTGDLGRMEPGGPVHYLGRADNQVKIRGYRVELDEIVAVLNGQPGVAAAAVVLRTLGESEELAAFVTPAADGAAEAGALRKALASRLPAYMVPGRIEMVDELPRLASGKIDLNALRSRAPGANGATSRESARAVTEDEAALRAALERILPGREATGTADFFDELGGHSLLAARLVSILREDPRYAALSVGDVYRERRLDGIARAMGRLRGQPQATGALPWAEVPAWRRGWCAVAQALAIPFFVLMHMADWLAPFFVYHYFTGDDGDSVVLAVAYSLTTFAVARFALFGVAIAGKWSVAGRLKAGRYPLWGLTYFRWWLAGKFCEMPDVYLLASTPWMPLYWRALGARVGRNALIDNITIGAPDLATFGEGVSLGTFVNIENARVEAGMLVLGAVEIGREVCVDSYAVLEENTRIGEGARLRGQSALRAGVTIGAGEVWDGAPAKRSGMVSETLPARPTVSKPREAAGALLFALTALAVSILFFLPTFPAFMLIDWLDAHTLDVFDSGIGPLAAFGFFFVLAIPASALFVGLTMGITAAIHRVLPRQKAGCWPVHGAAFWRKRLVTMILDSSLLVLHGLYASVYAPMWLRLLGMRVGRHAEVSTAEGMVPELLTLGDDSFIADAAMLGDEEQRGGWMTLKPTVIGCRSFVGNGAYVPDGAVVPDDVLIGVQTRAPANGELRSGQTWMGSPPVLLPARECLKGYPESLTFRPTAARRVGRGLVEGLRIVLPLAVVIAAGYLIVVLVMPVASANGWGLEVALALSAAGCIYGVASFLLVVALKWLLVGRYVPRAAPMWTLFVWLSEGVTSLYETMAVPNFLGLLGGTPWLPWALRLLGARLGRGVFLNTTDLTEFDCVRIGDEAELNAWCGPQTHLFEDRVMKIGTVEIGARVSVGARATILYDTHVGDGTRLGPLTLVAKGERLPPETRWEGSPAAPAGAS